MLGGEFLGQGLCHPEEFFIRRGVRAALPDEVIEQFRHLLVKTGSVSCSRMMVLRTLLMIPSAIAFLESFPFSLSFRAMASWIPVLMMSSVRDISPTHPDPPPDRPECSVDEVAHVRLIGLDIEFLPRVFLDGCPDLAVILDFLLQRGRFCGGISRFGKFGATAANARTKTATAL